MIKDSGNRREFATGAVRDMAEGKGRCDLLPLDVIASFFVDNDCIYTAILLIDDFQHYGECKYLLGAIREFCKYKEWDIQTGMLELAMHYEDGTKKYEERNWQKGIPVHSFIDSGVRHLLKHLRGDTDERHDRAFIWNMIGAVWTTKNKSELIDLPFAEEGAKENDKEA